ncbi:MAG: hypothetical protein ACR5LG_05645 [Sodalis sp. (in: enterobacteria)]|uniref:hypothetical protein n=1 Tax=Sodalis sp. (in: enterobacteria) TaxID=1898979 RepID=UPI003F3E354E
MSFANKDGLLIAKNMVAIIQKNKAWLSEIDGAAGDGDHGINMNKGFTLAAEKFTPAMTISEAFLLINGRNWRLNGAALWLLVPRFKPRQRRPFGY